MFKSLFKTNKSSVEDLSSKPIQLENANSVERSNESQQQDNEQSIDMLTDSKTHWISFDRRLWDNPEKSNNNTIWESAKQIGNDCHTFGGKLLNHDFTDEELSQYKKSMSDRYHWIQVFCKSHFSKTYKSGEAKDEAVDEIENRNKSSITGSTMKLMSGSTKLSLMQ